MRWSRSLAVFATVFVVLGLGVAVYRTQSNQGEISTATVSGVSLTIDYATTPRERAQGLGGRLVVPEGYGLVFVFPKDATYGFWMKNMLVPIDIFWLDAQGQVVHVEKNVDPSTYPDVFYPAKPARYVLETAAGFAERHGVTIGTQVLLKNPPVVLE